MKNLIKEANNNGTAVLGFNEQVVAFLKQEEKLLRDKSDSVLNRRDLPMYTKLINAYEKVVELIKKYDWELKYSEYTSDEIKLLSVWEQNGDGQIRNHKTWEINDYKK